MALDWPTLVRVVGDLEEVLGLMPSPVVTDPPAALERLVAKVRDLHTEHEAIEFTLDSDDACSLHLDVGSTSDQVAELVRRAYEAKGDREDAEELRLRLRRVGEELGRLEQEVDDALS